MVQHEHGKYPHAPLGSSQQSWQEELRGHLSANIKQIQVPQSYSGKLDWPEVSLSGGLGSIDIWLDYQLIVSMKSALRRLL